MRLLVRSALYIVLCALPAAAQTGGPQVNRDPQKVRFITEDIDNFWRAYDLAGKESDRAKRISIYQTEYLDKGSAGLADFVRLRIKSAKDLVAAIETQPKYYASIRPSTLRVREMEKGMRKSFRNFKKLYADAVFPDVYFVIGVSNTGGTTSKNGLLIGAEMYGLTPRTPREELADWMKAVLKPVEKLPAIVAHELIHFNQHYPEPKTLLGKSIQEGSADFIGELISDDTINPDQKSYGDRHEAELWREFQKEMNGASVANWMYNGLSAKDRPTDLGYYMGYKICRSYYKNARDKRQAIRDILEIKDFPAFLAASRYGVSQD
ncbi:MAG TPA: DUF2268 domain-containing putative Zn-dependent protease [Blastocatellia bacterium]|nr:DUF2268 domain-containing putative Zn-dependent protease [Blastocatellia bacterium]